VVITRRRDQAVVMMALEDYEALEETSYLLRTREMPSDSGRRLTNFAMAGEPNGIFRCLNESRVRGPWVGGLHLLG
jgi:hypothetical protein